MTSKEKKINEDIINGIIPNKPISNNIPSALAFLKANLSSQYFDRVRQLWQKDFSKGRGKVRAGKNSDHDLEAITDEDHLLNN